MPPRHPTLGGPPIAFAHRGARAHAPGNTLPAFALARELGATGLESDVRCTRDGVAVLAHDAWIRVGLLPRRVAGRRAAELPARVPTLAALYDLVGPDLPLSLDVKHPTALEPTLEAATAAGATQNLWLCHPDLDLLAGWVGEVGGAHLVHSTRLRRLSGGSEQHAARLRTLGIEAVNLHESEWSGGLVTLYHRFGIRTFGWDANHEHALVSLLAMGIDAVYSDHVDLMMASVHEVHEVHEDPSGEAARD